MPIFFLILGYLLGSIPFGVLIARLRGIDLRTTGSGNIGATNAARALGKPTGALVLFLDAGKAAAPLWPLVHLYHPAGCAVEPLLALLGLGAVLGHMFPVWLGFRGGKGVATSLGVFLVLTPASLFLTLAVWLLCYLVTHMASVGSLLAMAALPIILHLYAAPPVYVELALALLPLIVWKHRGNIARLLRRQESKI